MFGPTHHQRTTITASATTTTLRVPDLRPGGEHTECAFGPETAETPSSGVVTSNAPSSVGSFALQQDDSRQ